MIQRRHLLRTTGTALAVGIAGCSEQSGSGDGTGDDGGNGGDGNDGGNGDDGDDGDDGGGTATDAGDAGSVSGAGLTIDNVGVSAWTVTEDETGSVAPTGAENPTLTFEVGQRYAVSNEGWSAHPFALRAADDTPLLSQGTETEGEFEADAEVGWVDDGTALSFTYTEALSSEADYYICTIHPSMRGDVEFSG